MTIPHCNAQYGQWVTVAGPDSAAAIEGFTADNSLIKSTGRQPRLHALLTR
jgi:hypothetical protein